MSDKKKILELAAKAEDPLLHEDHPLPVSRRDFLSQGLIAGLTYAAAPTIMNLLSSPAMAEVQCDIGSGGSANTMGAPYFTIDLSGGAMLPAEARVLKNETDAGSMPTYTRMGHTAQSVQRVDTRFGLPFFSGTAQDGSDPLCSHFFIGLLETIPAAAQANVRIGGLAVRSQNDSGSNRMNASTLVAKIQQGEFYKDHIGTRNNSQSGGRSQPVYSIAGTALRVGSFNDLQNAVGSASGLASLSPEQKKEVAKSVHALTEAQRKALGKLNSADQLVDGTVCAQRTNEADLDKEPVFDPAQVADAVNIFDLNNTGDVDGMNRNTRAQHAAIANAGLKGYVGPATQEMGGYDHHGRNRADSNMRLKRAGQAAGRILALAAAFGVKAYISVITDGGIGFQENNPNPRSDNRSTSYSFALTYDPEGPREMRALQRGVYNDNQAVDNTHWLDQLGPEGLGIAHFLNWANFSFGEAGLGARLAQVIEPGDFDPSRIGDALLFG